MSVLKNIIVLTLFITVFTCYGQDSLSEIDFEKIPSKKVCEYIEQQEENNITSFSEIEPSLKTDSKTDGYKIHTKEYYINDNLQNVWNHYIHVNPADAWNSKRVSVGLIYSNKDNKLIYNDTKVNKLEKGQIVYLNLKLLKGLIKLATVIEFITIDPKNYVVEYSYIKGNKTEGKQRMEFFEDPKGHTCIVHSSYFKSDSKLRDRFFYPFFHDKLSNDFHRNMRKLYFRQKQNSIINNSEYSVTSL